MKSTHPAPTPARPRGEGFSLVELLVVISILALLIGILVPALSNIRESSKRAASRSLLGTLEFGLQQYAEDFRRPDEDDAYQRTQVFRGLPPSGYVDSDYLGGRWHGSQALVQALTGYRDDDGNAGEGFRTIARGQVYGPYVDSGKLTIAQREAPDGTSRPVILDSFDNVVLYYRFDPKAGQYHDGDNADDGPEQGINDYLRGATDGAGYPRTDYVLITPGTDGEWTTDWSANDDVTNFTE